MADSTEKTTPVAPTPDQVSEAEQAAKAEQAPDEQAATNPLYLPRPAFIAIARAVLNGYGEESGHVAIPQGSNIYKVGVPINGGGHNVYLVELPENIPVVMVPTED